ncbi:MAG: ABC-F family ATP-binding cassette domain-containing protein [Anaerolineaceae bacterium]|nr:ABC-F family ATP-binding cassette domain-containing protein [Anaerolineaceae bacterium]
MHIIQIDRLTVNHAGREIFRDLTWAISDKERTGLVGPNGSGKSSLLKALAGVVTPESGTIIAQRGVSIGYLPQDVALTPGRTLLEEALVIPPELAQIEAELERLENRLADPSVYGDEGKLARTLAQQETALERYAALGGPQHESRVKDTLARLGITPADYDLPTDTLSGGQKKLVMLARLSVELPTVLLLDEPDNHLDLDAKQNLERFIAAYPGAVVIVSHDRYLLDEVASQIAELENGRLTLYPGNYTAYANERELRRLRQQQQYLAQQKEITRIETMIHIWEQKAKADLSERHARQAASRRKMLSRMEERGEVIERVTERRLMEIELDGWRGSNKALELKNVAMGFGDDLLFLDVNLLIKHGERVGLVGPNGAGKSVLFRLILGQLEPLEGEIKIGPSSQIGYYSQEHQTLAAWLDRTPLELVRDIKPMSEGDGVAFLLKFRYTYEQTRMPVRSFSGGERSRLQLACLMLQNPNLLLLDEPSNNLDIQSVEVLESVLDDFEGAVLAISHDRYFLDRVADRVVELDNGALTAYIGGYTDYLAARDGRR